MNRELAPNLRRALGQLLIAVLLSVFGWTGSVRAHPDLDEAKRLASDLEFDAALAAFDAALTSGKLTRDELIQLLAERTLVLHALHRKDQLVRDFVWLSAVAPDYRLDLRAAPDLTALWTSVRDQGRGLLKVVLNAEAKTGEVSASASLTGTVPDGARARLWARRKDQSFEALALPELREAVPEGGSVELFAQAVGLGDVVLAEDHDASNPLRIEAGLTEQHSAPPLDSSGPSWAKRHRGWLIGGAAVVVVAAAVVTGVLLAKKGDETSDKTNLKPMVSF